MGVCQSKQEDDDIHTFGVTPTVVVPRVDYLSYRFRHGKYKNFSIQELLEQKDGVNYLISVKNNDNTTAYIKDKITISARLYYKDIYQLVR